MGEGSCKDKYEQIITIFNLFFMPVWCSCFETSLWDEVTWNILQARF